MIPIGICAFVAWCLWLMHHGRTIIDGTTLDDLLADDERDGAS